MSEQKHTPEPWGFTRGTYHHTGYVVITAQGMTSESPLALINDILGDAEHDARRIVACVNACAGIPTEDLEDRNSLSAQALGRFISKPSRDQIRLLEQQRDQLLTECRLTVQLFDGLTDQQRGQLPLLNIKALRAAITEAEKYHG